jgi:hypothetical protein
MASFERIRYRRHDASVAYSTGNVFIASFIAARRCPFRKSHPAWESHRLVLYSYPSQAITLLPSRKSAACIIAMSVEPRKIVEFEQGQPARGSDDAALQHQGDNFERRSANCRFHAPLQFDVQDRFSSGRAADAVGAAPRAQPEERLPITVAIRRNHDINSSASTPSAAITARVTGSISISSIDGSWRSSIANPQ